MANYQEIASDMVRVREKANLPPMGYRCYLVRDPYRLPVAAISASCRNGSRGPKTPIGTGSEQEKRPQVFISAHNCWAGGGSICAHSSGGSGGSGGSGPASAMRGLISPRGLDGSAGFEFPRLVRPSACRGSSATGICRTSCIPPPPHGSGRLLNPVCDCSSRK